MRRDTSSENGPVPDLSLYERLIDDGIAAHTAPGAAP